MMGRRTNPTTRSLELKPIASKYFRATPALRPTSPNPEPTKLHADPAHPPTKKPDGTGLVQPKPRPDSDHNQVQVHPRRHNSRPRQKAKAKRKKVSAGEGKAGVRAPGFHPDKTKPMGRTREKSEPIGIKNGDEMEPGMAGMVGSTPGLVGWTRPPILGGNRCSVWPKCGPRWGWDGAGMGAQGEKNI